MKIAICNSFSTKMLDRKFQKLKFFSLNLGEALTEVENRTLVSFVGHADTAAIISNLLKVDVPMNRAECRLNEFDAILVAEYCGPRLPEGTTQLPDGAEMRFWLIGR